MNFEPAGPLRTSTNLTAPRTAENGDARRPGSPATASTRSSDLVAELIAATELVPRDRLAAARGRAGIGGLAQALQDEGYAHPDGVARSLARRYGFPFIDLADERASPSASELIPLKTLQRVVAVPVSRTDDRLRVAVADPANIHGIDELRLATRYTVDIGVAQPRGDPRRARAHRPPGRGDGDAVRARRRRGGRRRGRPRGRRRRLGRAARAARQLDRDAGRHRRRERYPFRAAGGLPARPGPRRRRAQRDAADPEADGERRHDPPEGAGEARHRGAPQAAGRTDRPERARGRAACSTSASPCSRQSRASRS